MATVMVQDLRLTQVGALSPFRSVQILPRHFWMLAPGTIAVTLLTGLLGPWIMEF